MLKRGFSLVELVVVIAIMSILLSIATLKWNEMQMKSAIESQIRKIYADLMEVRTQAFYRKRARSVDINGKVYNLYSSAVITSTPLETKLLRYPVVWDSGGVLTFNTQGIISSERTLCILPTNDATVINSATVDSIIVSELTIVIGKRTGGVCTSYNIERE